MTAFFAAWRQELGSARKYPVAGTTTCCASRADAARSARTRPRSLYIDHDHTLGIWAVRGLVCHRCNQALRAVDAGQRKRPAAVSRYLASAWHRRQSSRTAKCLFHISVIR
ncbi:endonuclease domain-containing protein [Streptomyces sp. NPDC002143]